MPKRRLRSFIRQLNALVKKWKERWTLAAGGFALAMRRLLQWRSPYRLLHGLVDS